MYSRSHERLPRLNGGGRGEPAPHADIPAYGDEWGASHAWETENTIVVNLSGDIHVIIITTTTDAAGGYRVNGVPTATVDNFSMDRKG
jgi:hypothetical protein